jgi:hypothetical protein
MQYFCNVSDEELSSFVNPSVLCRFRQRLSKKGIAIIESTVFDFLRQSDVIKKDTLMMDSTVLSSNIIYPTDVQLLYKAFGKMCIFADSHELPFWWNQSHIKKQWRAFNRSKGERVSYLTEFNALFVPALETFCTRVETLEVSESEKAKAQNLLALLTLLKDQTQQKLAGEQHIDNRIVSLDEIDARPIKKGKSYPSCEFGTTLQHEFQSSGIHDYYRELHR